MKHTFWEKILSGFLIFFLLFSFTFRIPFYQFFLSVFAGDIKYYDIVSIIVEEDIYGSVKGKLERYAHDIEGVLENTKVVILPVPSDASVFKIASLNESLYFEGYKSLENVNFKSKLVGTVLVGKIPLPIAFDSGNFSKSILPFVDFENKGYVYNHETNVYEKDATQANEINADIWHGFISPNTGERGKNIQQINDYFDKNHDFYTGSGKFTSSIGVINAKKDDVIPNNYEPFVFYYDQIRENQAVDISKYKGYLAYNDNIEDITYKRYSKELAEKVKDYVISGNDTGINDLIAKLGGQLQTSSSPDLTNSSDILSRYVTQSTTKNFLQVFNEGTISDFRTFVHNAGRYNKTGSEVNVDLVPFLVTVLDLVSAQVIKDANTKMEDYIDTIVTNNNSRKIAIPTHIENNDGVSNSSNYVNFLYGKNAENITTASECTIYRGSLTASGTLVEANRAYNISNNQLDLSLCSGDINRDGKVDTAGYWGGNSPLNLDIQNSSNGQFSLTNNNFKKSITPLFDMAGSQVVLDVSKTPSPLQCYENNFLLGERRGSFRIPDLGTPINWNCATNNISYDYVGKFDDFYKNFSSLSIPSCTMYNLWLDGKIVKTKEDISDLCTRVTNVIDYKYKSITSLITHKSPIATDLTAQVNSMITPSLPIDKKRYIDYIASDGTYEKMYYPQLFSFEGGEKNDINYYKDTLKKELDKSSNIFSTIIQNTNPNKLSGLDREIYDLLKAGEYNGSSVDFYNYLSSQGNQAYIKDRETKDTNYIDTLSFSLYWKNLNSPSTKYKFIFENYLSDEFGGNNFNFHLPKNKKSYEIAYLGAPGDSKNMYIKVDPDGKSVNPYSQIIANNTLLNTSLLSYNITSSNGNSEETFKCSPPDGVPIWEWIPAVICRLKDMLPPKISISDGACGPSLFTQDEITELNECNGDINKNGVNDCIETKLKAGKLELEGDSSRYYYNKSGTLKAIIKDKDGKQVNFDNSTKVKFQLQKIIAPQDSQKEFNATNTQTVYESSSETDMTRKEVSKYINFKSLNIQSDAGEADLFFSTKGKDADLYFQAFIDIKNSNGNTELFLESEKVKIEIRGDKIFTNTYKLIKDNSPTASFGNDSLIASQYTNIYIVDGGKTNINTNSSSLQNNSLATEKLVFSLSNFSSAGNKLEIAYPLTVQLLKDGVAVGSRITINEGGLNIFKGLFSLSEANNYTLKITDAFKNNFSKNFKVLPNTAVRADIKLGTSFLEQGGVITTNIITLYDTFNNPVIGNIYTIEGKINGSSLVFSENEKDNITFQTVEGYRTFRLKSKNSSGENNVNFVVKDNEKKTLFSQTVNVNVLQEIKLDIQALQSEIKVGGQKYAYKVIAKDINGNKLSGISSRAYIIIDPSYGTLESPYFDIKNGEGIVYFKTKNLAGENIKIEFQLEGVNLIAKKYIDILPEKPVKIDISLSKPKMEASRSDFSLASVSLKDRYGNIVFSDNTSQFQIELLEKYKNIITFDSLSKIAKKGRQEFKIFGTDIPGKAYFKVSTLPNISENTFAIVGQGPFSRELLTLPGFTANGTLSETGKKFFEEVSSTLYKSKFSSLSSLQSSEAYRNLASSSLQTQLNNFWQEKNIITITPESENASSIETFYFWSKEKIQGKKYNALYTTLLGSSYGDITEENYLAGSLLFDKDNRALAVTSLLNNPYKYNDVVSFGKNGLIKKVYNTKDLSQNISSSVSLDNDEKLKIFFQNNALGTSVGEAYFNFDKNNIFLKKCSDGVSDFTNCEFSKKETSILLKSSEQGYTTFLDGGNLILKNSFGEEVFRINEEGKIIKKGNIYFVLDESSKNMSQILIKSSDKILGILGINFVNMQFAKTKDINLIPNYKQSLKNSIIFFGHSDLYSMREISDGKNYTYFIYYNDPFSSNLQLDSFSQEYLNSYENFSEESGVGWKEGNKTLLGFSTGKSVGEATKDYQSFSLINLGDPVIALKDIKKTLPGTTKERSFDATIGELIIKDSNIISYKVFDYNSDEKKDIVVYKNDGYVNLYENEKADSRFRDLGHLAYLQDAKGKNIFEAGDFSGDGYDDIFFVNNTGKPFLLNNISKDFSRYSLESNFSLSGNIIRVKVFDMDNDRKDDIITLDDSGEINVFYGGGSSEYPRFTKSLVGNGYGLELNNSIINTGGFVYFNGLYQMPQTPDTSSLLSSNDAYLTQLQNNISSFSTGTTDIYAVNEGYVDNLIFEQLSYTPFSLRHTIPTPGAINQSDISSSYQDATGALDAFINSNNDYVGYTDSYYNSSQNTTFIKSQYAESQGVKVEKQYTDKNGGTLKIGDKIKVDVTLTNTSRTSLSDVSYVESIESPFAIASDFKFISEDGLNAVKAPSNYAFMVEGFTLDRIIHFSYEMNTLSMKFGYLQVGLFEKGEVGDDLYGDIVIKPNEKNCGNKEDIYRSTAERLYQKGEKQPSCNSNRQTTSGTGYSDTNNNKIPDYIDNLLTGNQQAITDYANKEKENLFVDSDGDGIPDSEDTFNNYNDNQGLDSLGSLAQAVDTISSQMDTIIQGFGCGFGGGSCFASPLNWAPLAPGNDPTLMGMPIGDGLRVNEGIPVFSALTGLQMMCGHSPCCIPVVYPVSPLAYVPGPKCGKPSAGGYLGTWAPSNYVRMFITPTLTGGVGTAVCFGGPANIAGYANPPGLHPIVPGGNCVVAAMPLLGCKDDGSDGDIGSQGFSQTSGNGAYDIINGNCDETSSPTPTSTGTSLDTNLVRDYVTYKKTGIRSKTLEQRIKEMFSTVARQNNSSSNNFGQNSLINLEGGGANDMSLSLDINTDTLANGNFSDVIQFNMKRVWPFPDFLMEWVTRQIEEIVTKLTDFPTLFIILPDFSGIMDSSWENFTTKVSDTFNKGKTKQENKDKAVYSSLEKMKQDKTNYCFGNSKDDLKCAQTNARISKLERKNTFSSQTISGISEVYQFLSQMPLVSIEPEVVSINIPWIDQTSLDKALIEWRITRDNWQNEINIAKESWSMGALCNQAVESEKKQCQDDNAAKNKIFLNADALITSLDRNIQVLEDYKKFPEKLNKLITKKEDRLEQILCNIESISQITGGWIEKNGKRFKIWVELYILIKAVLKSWQLLIDVFVDYENSCHQCKNERDDLLYFAFKIINMIIPKIPVIQFPKWPDIILDLHNIRAGMVIYMPEFKFNLRPFIIPSLPNLTFPTTPNINIKLPNLPVLDTFELPNLPDLPTLPKVELPDLPPPPKLPKIFSSLEGIINILKLVTKAMCILKSSPFVPEWRAGDQIAFITERKGYLPTDFLDLSLPQFSFPFVDAIKVTTYVNLEFDNEFIVEMVRQMLMPLNTMTNNIVNMTDWNIQGVDFADKAPLDINVEIKTNGNTDTNLGASSAFGKKFIENFAYSSVKNIVALVHTLDAEKSKELSISDFKFVIAQELAKKTIKDDPNLEELKSMWQGILVYDFAQENEIIKNQKQENKEKFDTIRNIISTEKNETKKQKGMIKNLKVSSGIKNIAFFEKSQNTSQYQESMQKYNSKFMSQAKKLLANGTNKEAEQMKKQGDKIFSSVKGGLSAFQTKYDISQKDNKLLAVAIPTNTSSSSGNSKSVCSKVGTNGQTYTYQGLYVVEDNVSYKLFDYIDQLKGNEEVTTIDYDNDGDEDLLYMVNGEIFLKTNTKNSGTKEFVDSPPFTLNSKDNKFFDGKDIFSESINGFKESEVTNGYINLSFSAPKRFDTSAFRVNFYDKVDKYTNLLDTNYVPENTKRHIIDAFVGTEENLKKEETEEYIKYNNLGRISYIGTAPGITMQTKEFINIRDDIIENRVVNISSTTQVYSGKNGVRIGYIYSGDDMTNTDNYKYLYLEKYSHLEFSNPVRIISLDGDAYIETGRMREYQGQDIMNFIGMPLLPDTKIYVSDTTKNFNPSTNIEITYYDDTKLNIDWRDDTSYEIYDLGNISDSYLIQTAKPNDYYYANIYSLRGDIIGNYSNQILLSPQREADVYAPEIKLSGAVRIPVYQKQTFDFTSSLYENTGIQGIKDFYIDFDLTKDTSGDGNPKNDRDSEKIKITKTINSIKGEFGVYNTLFKKKIALIAKDQNDNVGYKEIDFEVYAPIPSIKTVNNGLINGLINERLDIEPVNIYRYRGGIISKILDISGQQKVNTFSGGVYDFHSVSNLPVGQGLAIKKDGNEIATVDEHTGYISLKNPGYTISVLPSSQANIYPKISVSDTSGELYYEYIKFSREEDIKIVENFETIQEKGIYINFTDKANYNYYEIPAGVPLNPGAVVIYGGDTGRNIPLFTFLKDGRIYTHNDKYKLEYANYAKNIVFKLMDKEKGKEIAKVMYVIDGNFMVE